MANRAYLDTTGEWGRKAERERKAKPHYVYFIRCLSPHESPVKIGISNDPMQRVASMEGHNPWPLEIISIVECADFAAALREEKRLHGLFDEYRVRGEWFRDTPALVQYMYHVATPWAPPEPPRFEIPRTREELMDFFGLREDD